MFYIYIYNYISKNEKYILMFNVIFKYKCKKKIVGYSSKTSNTGTNYLFVQSLY